ncbi:AAA family ATPase [Pedobacter sp. MR22-3]|uniref:AAA family ATPase n=1 Tax=Pedobacter sp. MR22-3 TaxID=2994552 RepID=UPI002AFE0BA5|nr:AAA family ATPase [Pedobacter sp. MR22-3]
MEDYIRFKKLLEYFVAHLEWVVNLDITNRGYDEYIHPLIEKGIFRKTGQGYANDKIQQHIKDWEDYPNGTICINIQQNFGSYLSSKCYLNWEDTGLNIIAKWSGKNIISLYQEEYFYWENPKRRKEFSKKISLVDLGLFTASESPTDQLVDFYNIFENAIIRYNVLEEEKKMEETLKPIMDLLLYKKQIILQGPPGTGKTRVAKMLAENLVGRLGKSISADQIVENVSVNQVIRSVGGKSSYLVLEVDSLQKKIKIKRESETEDYTSFKDVIEAFESKLWLSKIEQNNPRRAASIAKFIFEKISNLNDSDQFKIIQFHPSYSYEDFVRGIVAEPADNGEQIKYKAQNKILGAFADKALENFIDTQKTSEVIKNEDWVRNLIKRFQEDIEDRLYNEEKIWLTPNVAYITRITNEAIRYKSDNWKIDGGIPYSDIEKMYLADAKNLADVRELETLTASGKYNAIYWLKLLEKFKEYVKKNGFKAPSEKETINVKLKNYVLIIDEINRANLSSVLGELIYALEYRGEGLESMYSLDDGKRNIVIPPNLYIIGTMNTADRSVGHIDYAIRRRFAFYSILPKSLKDDDNIYFNSDGFDKISMLFNETNVSDEFEIKDVQLGHSYFIAKKSDETDEMEKDKIFAMKMDYEIIPLLLEYVKDGILIGKFEGKSIKEYIESLRSE